MLSWFNSWWVTTPTGPARNIPATPQIKIRDFFEQRPKSVILVSAEEIGATRAKLKPTIINALPPISHKAPILQEFEDLFCDQGISIFEKIKQKRLLTN